LRVPVLEIDLQGYDRITALAHAAPQSIDLLSMQQQLPSARLLVTELPGGRVSTDVDAVEKNLAVLYTRIAVTEVRFVRPHRCAFWPDQRAPRFHNPLNEQTIAALSILHHHLQAPTPRFAIPSRHELSSIPRLYARIKSQPPRADHPPLAQTISRSHRLSER